MMTGLRETSIGCVRGGAAPAISLSPFTGSHVRGHGPEVRRGSPESLLPESPRRARRCAQESVPPSLSMRRRCSRADAAPRWAEPAPEHKIRFRRIACGTASRCGRCLPEPRAPAGPRSKDLTVADDGRGAGDEASCLLPQDTNGLGAGEARKDEKDDDGEGETSVADGDCGSQCSSTSPLARRMCSSAVGEGARLLEKFGDEGRNRGCVLGGSGRSMGSR